jgi:hypothetical protein
MGRHTKEVCGLTFDDPILAAFAWGRIIRHKPAATYKPLRYADPSNMV